MGTVVMVTRTNAGTYVDCSYKLSATSLPCSVLSSMTAWDRVTALATIADATNKPLLRNNELQHTAYIEFWLKLLHNFWWQTEFCWVKEICWLNVMLNGQQQNMIKPDGARTNSFLVCYNICSLSKIFHTDTHPLTNIPPSRIEEPIHLFP